MKNILRSLTAAAVVISSVSCIQSILKTDELISDKDLPSGVLPSENMTYGSASAETYATHAARYSIKATDEFPYVSIELFGDGSYLITKSGYQSVYGRKATKGYEDSYYIAGGYTVEQEGHYSLEDFGTLKIEEEGDGFNLIFDNTNGNRLSTVFATKDAIYTDDASKSLCRTWDLNTTEEWMYLGSNLVINTKYTGGDNPRIEGKIGVDSEELQESIAGMCKRMVFSPAGTYFCTYNDGTVRVSTWEWGNAEQGILFFDWKAGEQDEGYVTIRFAGKQMRTYEDYIFDIKSYIEEELDEEEEGAGAYIEILEKFAGDSKLRYLIVNSLEVAD